MKKGWVTKKLGDVTTKIGSGATPLGGGDAYKPTGISLIRSLNVYDDGLREAKLAKIDDDQADRLSNVTVEPNDVLLNITGASIARCCVVPVGLLPARVNQHVSIIRPAKDKLDSAFLHYLLISNTFKNRLLHVGEDGGATRQAITKAQLQDFSIKYPESLSEQRHIVSILDKSFDAIATAKANAGKNLKNARALFESHLEAVFSQRGAGAEKALSDTCEISSVLIDPRRKEYLDLLHVGGANIESKTGRLIELKTAREEGLKSGKFIFDNTMVLYSKIRPYLMKVARPDFRGLCSADIYPLSAKADQLDRNYLFHLLLSPRFTEYANMGSARAGMPKVNREHLFSFRVNLPSVENQKLFAAKLDALHNETQNLERIYLEKSAMLDALKKSLLHQAFAGEL